MAVRRRMCRNIRGTSPCGSIPIRGSVPGISTYVDLDVAYFGYSETAEAQEEGSAQHVEADPEVGVKFDEVSEQVTSKDTTESSQYHGSGR